MNLKTAMTARQSCRDDWRGCLFSEPISPKAAAGYNRTGKSMPFTPADVSTALQQLAARSGYGYFGAATLAGQRYPQLGQPSPSWCWRDETATAPAWLSCCKPIGIEHPAVLLLDGQRQTTSVGCARGGCVE